MPSVPVSWGPFLEDVGLLVVGTFPADLGGALATVAFPGCRGSRGRACPGRDTSGCTTERLESQATARHTSPCMLDTTCMGAVGVGRLPAMQARGVVQTVRHVVFGNHVRATAARWLPTVTSLGVSSLHGQPGIDVASRVPQCPKQTRTRWYKCRSRTPSVGS